ncbi:hypothetical protein PVAP13_2NG496500 [Panicum virgatum]|uniref:Uncharacterized protein n=1 Tax=Panicum virgatum TaxID=38727 RepID=A0A8T0VQB0_PANVG|nr:hypothetical protein PVAP13_2NG496500 [Panicum virgatum]
MENLLLTVLIICNFLLTWHLGALSIVYPFQADSWCLLEYYWVLLKYCGLGWASCTPSRAQKCIGMPVIIEDLRKIDNWQYINSVNLWVRFLCCNYKDYNLNPLFSQVLQVIGVAHLFPGTRYLLRLKLVQMLNELCTWSQMFFPIPSLLFDCLDFREVSQKEQTQKTKVNFSSLLKVPKSLLKSRDFQEECVQQFRFYQHILLNGATMYLSKK